MPWRDLLKSPSGCRGPNPGLPLSVPHLPWGRRVWRALGGVVVRGTFGDSGCKVLLEGCHLLPARWFWRAGDLGSHSMVLPWAVPSREASHGAECCC